MCGIFGTYHQTCFDHGQKSILMDMFRVGMVRGVHGTGIVSIDNKNQMMWRKVGGEPYTMYWTEGFDEFIKKVINDSRFVFGHHRAATKGEVNDDNAHPFQHDHITLVHNGTLTGGVQLKDGEVDSDALTKLVAEKGAKEAFNQVSGPYACVWWDANQNRLNFIKNGGRPLVIAKARGNHFWASEGKMLDWLLSRHYSSISPKEITWYEFENDRIYYLDGRDTLMRELEPIKKPYVVGNVGNSYKYPATTTQTHVSKVPALPPPVAKHNQDHLANFYLFSEEMKTYTSGIVRWKYLGLTEGNENVMVVMDEPLQNYKDNEWHGILKVGHRMNYSKLIDPTQDEQAVFYEVESRSLIELIEHDDPPEDKPKGRYNTKDGHPLSKNKMKRFIKDGCITCKGMIIEADVSKCLAFTSHEGDPKALFCPKCTDVAVKRREKNNVVPLTSPNDVSRIVL